MMTEISIFSINVRNIKDASRRQAVQLDFHKLPSVAHLPEKSFLLLLGDVGLPEFLQQFLIFQQGAVKLPGAWARSEPFV